MEVMEVKSFWKNKKVFLTGHSGFKGSWMSLWLLQKGAQVVGYSKDVPTKPSLFEELKLEQDMRTIWGDVRDLEQLKKSVTDFNPDILIHMAAQPLVRYSYNNPVETYMTNVMGTVHTFEAARAASNVKAVVNVTSDKCYENFERLKGYSEDEPMGGFDPYSNSKGCSELVTRAYRSSYFQSSQISLGSGRAGNVIGGGDWALDRLVPDIVRSVIDSRTLTIRNPKAIRPWQHVLEPVAGYFKLAEALYSAGQDHARGYNFGPEETDHCDVETIIKKMNSFWENKIRYEIISSEANPHEAHYLKLNCDLAKKELNWLPRWTIDQALQKTVEWNQMRLKGDNVQQICIKQINDYESK